MYKIQTPDDFLSTPWRMTIFDSCVMRLQTIGEYVKKIDDKTNKQLLPKYPQVPWVKVIGQRNIISLANTLLLMRKRYSLQLRNISHP
ncbi:MAG: HepT-like ribonuclease domain-containing protein [Parabacteroides merdae]